MKIKKKKTREKIEENKVAKDKRFKLGSEETVAFSDDKGLFSAVQAAYNNHWVLRTRPEDW